MQKIEINMEKAFSYKSIKYSFVKDYERQLLKYTIAAHNLDNEKNIVFSMKINIQDEDIITNLIELQLEMFLQKGEI